MHTIAAKYIKYIIFFRRQSPLKILLTHLMLPLITMVMAAEPPPNPRKNSPAPTIDLNSYVLTFQDEFNGNTLDTSKWEAPAMPRQGGSRWNPQLVTVQDGFLRLGIRLTNDPILRYDCGAVRTQRNYDRNQTMFGQAFGYFETRCKLPRRIDADYFADFWIMAGKVSEGNNTRAGNEIDIFESFELAEGHPYSMNFHWGGYGKQHNVYGLKCGQQPQLRDGKFHTYGLLWTEEFYAVYVDGTEIGRTDMLGLGSGKDGKMLSNGPCQEPGYLKLTVEAAKWPGKSPGWEPDAPTEDEFIIDWVRAYLPKPKNAPSQTSEAKPTPRVPQPPAQPKLTVTPEGLAAFDQLLRQRVVALVAANKGPQFLISTIHQLARIDKADVSGEMVLLVNDSELTWSWSRLDLMDRCRLSLACARANHPGDAGENAFWLFATGQNIEAERQLSFADTPGVTAVRSAFITENKAPLTTDPDPKSP